MTKGINASMFAEREKCVDGKFKPCKDEKFLYFLNLYFAQVKKTTQIKVFILLVVFQYYSN